MKTYQKKKGYIEYLLQVFCLFVQKSLGWIITDCPCSRVLVKHVQKVSEATKCQLRNSKTDLRLSLLRTSVGQNLFCMQRG